MMPVSRVAWFPSTDPLLLLTALVLLLLLFCGINGPEKECDVPFMPLATEKENYFGTSSF